MTACAIPPWIPEKIISGANQVLGRQLRQDLVEMKNRDSLAQPSSMSFNSGNFSIDSQDPVPLLMSREIHQNTLRIAGLLNKLYIKLI